MSDTFLNNQEVTAEDLNQIAIDLGYADYSHFPEDPPQSAVSALNQITADLTSEGILRIGNQCEVSITGNIITVQDGVCVFDNGAKKRIEEATSIAYVEGGTNYVHLRNDTAGNKIELVNSLEEPTEGDFVLLAIVDKNKVVHNRRTFSRSKVNIGVQPTEETTFTAVEIDYPEDKELCIGGQVLDVDLTQYNYAIMYYENTNGDTSRSNGCFGLYDLNKGLFTIRILSGGSTHYYGTVMAPWATEGGYYNDRVRIIDGVLSCITSADYPRIPKITIRFV